MAKEKVLITVKTYPTYSKSYEELVCTAGFKEDGSFIRIYPMPYRKLEYAQQFEKYRWIELELVRNTKDFRPESYRPVNIDNVILGESVGTDNGTWERRKEICLRNVYASLDKLIDEAHDQKIMTSLAVFKPTEVIDVIIEKTDREWPREDEIAISKEQLLLFPEHKNLEIVKKVPYNFSYKFKDINGRLSTLMISDWEASQLYWNCLAKHNDEERACIDVKKKYLDSFRQKDLYFFLGTTKEHHFVSRNPFIIIGVFYPVENLQGKLF